MKKSLSYFAFMLAMTTIISFHSYRHQSARSISMIDSVVVNKQTKLVENDSLSPICQLHINLKYMAATDSLATKINNEITRTVFHFDHLTPQMAVDSFVNHYLRRYHNDLAEYYAKDPEAAWYNYTYDITSQLHANDPRYITYQLITDIYEGGAHGSHTLTYLNFDKADGHLLTLHELFNQDFESELTQLLIEALKNKLQVNSIEELQELGFLIVNDMYPSENFLLDGKNIRFYYNAYEIAPYSVGPTELILSMDQLTDILNPNFQF